MYSAQDMSGGKSDRCSGDVKWRQVTSCSQIFLKTEGYISLCLAYMKFLSQLYYPITHTRIIKLIQSSEYVTDQFLTLVFSKSTLSLIMDIMRKIDINYSHNQH